jgi:hypothetical protein
VPAARGSRDCRGCHQPRAGRGDPPRRLTATARHSCRMRGSGRA